MSTHEKDGACPKSCHLCMEGLHFSLQGGMALEIAQPAQDPLYNLMWPMGQHQRSANQM